MANIFYAPGGFNAQMLLSDSTVGPISGTKTGGLPATSGTLTPSASQGSPAFGIYPPSYGSFQQFNVVGKFADAGEVADCLNQLVLRIQALESLIASNPSYGVIPT